MPRPLWDLNLVVDLWVLATGCGHDSIFHRPFKGASFLVVGAPTYFDYVNFNTTGFRPAHHYPVCGHSGLHTQVVSRVWCGCFHGRMGVDIAIPGCCFKRRWWHWQLRILRLPAHGPSGCPGRCFILWVFTSLSRTLNQVQARRAAAKLDLYRKFTNTLAVMVWVSVAWIALEMYVRVTDPANEKWQYDWILGDFWYMLNFFFLIIIAFLFRPSATSTSYAYSELEGEDDYETVDKPKLKDLSPEEGGEGGKLE
eukprot:jgi/Botrbrau1/14371/Bobra.0014s0026.1